MNSQQTKNATRVVAQYRYKRAMVYELECDGVALDLHVSPRKDQADSGEWRVEARTSHDIGGSVCAEWGATRADALRAVERAWVTKASSLGLPAHDWEAIVKALSAVRAV